MPKVVLTETWIYEGKIFLPNEVVEVPQGFLDNRKEGEYTLVDPPAPKAKKAPTTPTGAGSDTPPTGAGSDTPPDGAGA